MITPLVGDLLLVRDTDFISRTIETVTRSPYSHVAIFTGQNELIEAQGFRRVGYQDAGVYAGKADVFRCDFLTTEQRERIVASVKSHIGQHYDYGLLVVEWVRYTFGLVVPWYEHDVVICSTLADDGYQDAGIHLCPGISLPSPSDIAVSKILNKISPF